MSDVACEVDGLRPAVQPKAAEATDAVRAGCSTLTREGGRVALEEGR